MKTHQPQQPASPDSYVGQSIGEHTIENVIFLDRDTTLICCKSFMTDFGTAHMEAEHWLTENTFHYNTLYYDEHGNFIFSEPEEMRPEQMRTFERIFTSLAA